MVWRSILLWLLAVVVLILIVGIVVGAVEAWPWMKKFKNNNEDANAP
jgi:hypothetical protein